MKLNERFAQSELTRQAVGRIEFVQCMTCGAAVVAPERHNNWHIQQEEEAHELSRFRS